MFMTVICLTLVSVKSFANRKLAESYIDTYKSIAIAEMKRTGIPASIKLAQGILESDLGRSPLAYQANNHFGIKCGGQWEGEKFYRHDDDVDSSGTIIESCFRGFVSPEESYMAHSEFLMNPSKRSRYGFLFDIASTDYVGWANGLKFAGYATDPSYPQKLIKIIESNNLYKLDEPVMILRQTDVLVTAEHSNSNPQLNKSSQSNTKIIKLETKTENNIPKSTRYVISKTNDLKNIVASGHETIDQIAAKNNVSVHELMRYNEACKSKDYRPARDEIVFLEKKKRAFHTKDNTSHTVAKGETIYSISQLYGIRLESLLAKNNLPNNAEPILGSKISLSDNLSKKDTPKYTFPEKFDSFVNLGNLK